MQDRAPGLAFFGGGGKKHSGVPQSVLQASQASKMKQKELSDTTYGLKQKPPRSCYTMLVGLYSHNLKWNITLTCELTDMVGSYGE